MKLKQDTLALQLNRPMTSNNDIGHVVVNDVITHLNEYLKNVILVSPEKEAIMFYLNNHILSVVQSTTGIDEPLEDKLKLITYYQSELSKASVRMFYYLLLICTRESRHVYGSFKWDNAIKKYGLPSIDFTKSIADESSSGAVTRFRESGLVASLGDYTGHLVNLFFTGGFSGGYGGEAWGKVAEVLHKFVTGEYTAEMMMDTAFTLCHNNGPIFNKGMLYTGYDSYEIVKILDVQRSGQIPQLVANKESPFITNDHIQAGGDACHILGACLSGHVDWFMVEDLGSMQKYPDKKHEQKNKYGLPDNHEAKLIATKEAKDIEQQAKDLKEAILEKQWFQVTPTQKVKKIELIRE